MRFKNHNRTRQRLVTWLDMGLLEGPMAQQTLHMELKAQCTSRTGSLRVS